MASTGPKSYRVDFFVVTVGDDRRHSALFDLLDGTAHTEAVPLDAGDQERFQIRSIVRLPGGGQAFKAVFGRCKFGETPLQGDAHGREEDVELKPGHGLVQKNHFLFFGRRNLLVWQRSSSSGSHYSRLQRYLRQSTGQDIQLAPVLTSDSYQRLIDGAQATMLELSFQQPADPTFYVNTSADDAVKLVQRLGGVNCRIRIGVARTQRRLINRAKDAALILAKHGLARVARVKLAGDLEPIDLIADRIVDTASVPLQANGRPSSEDLYAALNEAMDRRREDLDRFFGA